MEETRRNRQLCGLWEHSQVRQQHLQNMFESVLPAGKMNCSVVGAYLSDTAPVWFALVLLLYASLFHHLEA